MQYSRLSQPYSLCKGQHAESSGLKLACSRMGGQSPLQNSAVQCSAVHAVHAVHVVHAVHAVHAVNASAVQCLTVIDSEIQCSARNCSAGMGK